MADSKNLLLQLLITAKDEASAALGRIKDGVGSLGDAARQALEPLKTFGGLLGAALGIGGAKEVVDRADAYTRLSNQLRIAAKDEADYQGALTATIAVSKAANSDLDSTAQLYAKVKQNAADLRLSQQQIADVTELVAKGMQLSGASADAASGATLQFTQALASGVLRGEEFNSVIEASPALIKAIADGLGVGVGEMRALAEAGQLTSSRIVTALLSQKAAIDEVYGKLPQTVGQALTGLNNAATLFVGRLNEQTGATRGLTAGLGFLAQNLDAVAAAIGAGFAAAMAKGTAALAQNAQAALAARTAAREQAIASAEQQRAALASAQANLAAAQAAANRALAEQRAAQAQLVALESLAGLFASEQALTLARTQASAAANAATAATERYANAQAALNALQAPAAASVGLFARSLAFLAGPGGLILTAVTAFGALFAAFSQQKQPTDDLTQSTEQYAEALRKMSVAQAQVELGRINAQLDEQRQRVEAARAAYEQAANSQRDWIVVTENLGPILGSVNRVISDSAEIARIRAERQAQLDTETQKLVATEERHAQVVDSLNGKQTIAAENTALLIAAIGQQVTAMDKAGAAIEAYGKAQDAIAKAQQDNTQALIDLAKANNDVAEAERLQIKLAEQKAAAARVAAELARGEADAARLKMAALEAQRQAQGRLNATDAEALDKSRQITAQKDAEATAAENLARKLEQQAESERSGVAAKDRAIEKTERIVRASGSYISALESVRDAQLSGLRAEIQLAQQKGYTYTAQQKSIELARQETEWAQTLAQAKKLEIEAEIAATQAKLERAKAADDGSRAAQLEIATQTLQLQGLALQQGANQQLVDVLRQRLQLQLLLQQGGGGGGDPQQTENETQTIRRNTQTLQQNTEERERSKNAATAFAAVLASQIQYWEEESAKLSEATKALFDYKAGLSALDPRLGKAAFGSAGEEAQKAASEIQRLTQYALEAQKQMLFAAGDIGRLFARINEAGAQAQKAYYEQKLAAEQLEAQLSKIGETGGRSFASLGAAMQFIHGTAESNIQAFTLLNEQDLKDLRSAMDDANDKLREMQGEAQDAKDRIAELNAEIAAEKGDDARAAKLKLELEQRQALAEVEANLAKAQAENNRELIALYEEQKRKLEELYALKEKNLQQDQRQNQTANSSTNAGASSAKTYTLNLTGGAGAKLSTTTNTDPAGFLSALEAAQARST